MFTLTLHHSPGAVTHFSLKVRGKRARGRRAAPQDGRRTAANKRRSSHGCACLIVSQIRERSVTDKALPHFILVLGKFYRGLLALGDCRREEALATAGKDRDESPLPPERSHDMSSARIAWKARLKQRPSLIGAPCACTAGWRACGPAKPRRTGVEVRRQLVGGRPGRVFRINPAALK
ncbi:hypothetical protein SKAU_G00272780 [Synaphobranchus kaupii]|uniref:Uncharacterized protein n=1 Tax=Synaphobranchus kaupii TaxID=118154 RepID=A0A9Q1IQR4_SYNKA|nr:hypothetical protein SKAU_G00272780 [Synaphobranchus kaupii]